MKLLQPSPFADLEKIIENENAFAVYDSFPVSKGHALVIPREEVKSIFDLSDKKYSDCFELLKNLKILIEEKFQCQGFNIGINNGIIAGQTVYHAHIHVIPRYKNDMENPRGGIRKIFPNNDY